MRTISHDYSKLDLDTVANAIRPLVETDPSIKVKSIITEVQSRFNYTISYRKAWWTKQKSIAKVFGAGVRRQIGSEYSTAFSRVSIHALERSRIARYSRTVEEYNINYKRLEERGEVYVRWCDAIGLRHWVLTFDEGHRWVHMTMNLVECINSVLKGARNLPVLRIEANMQHAGNIVVHQFDRGNEVFEVREMTSKKVLVVDLARRKCDYGHLLATTGGVLVHTQTDTSLSL
ncbi:hypothetical protein Ahy_A02g007731 [Arachis hypogaea]|uniref:Uncharacterized protein n=1 Tax=Arachis hypogaea TaxID=3818 RepID=A0A445ED99_ARAHY|nr:hypothetical protein Ahy_A02g007731 [Arachis hypogaea]